MIEIGDHVIYVDERAVEHDALVTALFDEMQGPENPPGVNVVFVSGDEDRGDSYGRQIERQTSIVHEDNQPAHGMFWREV